MSATCYLDLVWLISTIQKTLPYIKLSRDHSVAGSNEKLLLIHSLIEIICRGPPLYSWKGWTEVATAHTTSDAHPAMKVNFLVRHPLPSFFTLAILISWLLAGPSLFFGLPFKIF